MIKAEDILNATHGGLDIILDCYPRSTLPSVMSVLLPQACGSTTQKVMAGFGR